MDKSRTSGNLTPLSGRSLLDPEHVTGTLISAIAETGTNGRPVSALDKLVTGLIGKMMGIKPEQVTTEFIHVWRERELYPRARFELGATVAAGTNVVKRL